MPLGERCQDSVWPLSFWNEVRRQYQRRIRRPFKVKANSDTLFSKHGTDYCLPLDCGKAISSVIPSSAVGGRLIIGYFVLPRSPPNKLEVVLVAQSRNFVEKPTYSHVARNVILNIGHQPFLSLIPVIRAAA